MKSHCVLSVEDLVALYGEDVAFVINFSGGKDSMRMLGLVRGRFPKHPMYVVMADTGFEHVKPISAEDWSRRRAADYGLPLAVVRNPNKTYLEMVERRRMFPSASMRTCTSDLKRSPVDKFIRALPHKVIVSCMGLRADESPARSKQVPWKLNTTLSVAGRTVFTWLPIHMESL